MHNRGSELPPQKHSLVARSKSADLGNTKVDTLCQAFLDRTPIRVNSHSCPESCELRGCQSTTGPSSAGELLRLLDGGGNAFAVHIYSRFSRAADRHSMRHREIARARARALCVCVYRVICGLVCWI